MNHTHTATDARTERMSPAEYAELVRDARAIVAAVERGTRRTAAVFVLTLGATVGASALGWDLAATLTCVVAVIAFTVSLLLLMARIALGAPPAEVADTTPAGPVENPANGSGGPATGSGPATAENRRILRK